MINESQNKQNKSSQDSANEPSEVESLDSANQGESSASKDEALDSAKNTSMEASEDNIQSKSKKESIKLPFAIGKKVGMTRIFDQNGRDYPATVIRFSESYVTQIKSIESDGYLSIQLGYDKIHEKKINSSQKGHLDKNGVCLLRNFKEFRVDSLDSDVKVGCKSSISSFELGDFISITGTSKGRGFAGHMKRHGFGGGRRSHGKNSVMRKSGSIGAGSDPSRVWPGTRMAGRFGNDRVTVKNLEVIRVDQENNQLFVKGAVPGAKNGTIYLVK